MSVNARSENGRAVRPTRENTATGRVLTLLSMGMFILTGCETPDRPTPPDLARGIDAVFADMASPNGPGASVAVIRDGDIIYSRGYGGAQLEYAEPVTPATIFHVASVSKQFAAMAVTMLAAEGALDLDDPVQKALPWVPDLGRPVTVRQMIHHTSGIRDQWQLLGIAGWRLDDVITTEQIKQLMSRQQALNFEPGSEYMYSNMGYTLLGLTVGAVSGMTFPEFTESRIFGPLGMTRTHFHDDHQMIVPDRAYSYSRTESGFDKAVLSYANAGATSLFTTAEDLALWLDNFRHQTVGGAEVLTQMQQRGVLNDGDTISYAHGLIIGEYRGLATVGHSGGDAGFRTQATWYPEANVGIVVLSNVGDGNPGGRAQQVADVVLAADFPDSDEDDAEGDHEAEGDEHANRVALSAEALEGIPARYNTSVAGVATIERDGDQLFIDIPGGPSAELIPHSDTEFLFEEVGALVIFEPGWESFRITSPEGEDVGTGIRLPDTVDMTAMGEYTGTYYSPELEALYTIAITDDGLVARHIRHGDIGLTPMLPDEFTTETWFLGTMRFRRSTAGTIEGFDLSGGRVRNVRFERLTTPLPS